MTHAYICIHTLNYIQLLMVNISNEYGCPNTWINKTLLLWGVYHVSHFTMTKIYYDVEIKLSQMNIISGQLPGVRFKFWRKNFTTTPLPHNPSSLYSERVTVVSKEDFVKLYHANINWEYFTLVYIQCIMRLVVYVQALICESRITINMYVWS